MKHLLSAFLIGCALASCSGSDCEDISGATYCKNYVSGYLMPESVEQSDAEGAGGVGFTLKGRVINSGAAYDELAETYGDKSFNRYVVNGPRIAVTDGLLHVKVLTVRDFDALHPAGSDVSDLIDIHYVSFLDYVRSGYRAEPKDVEQYSGMMTYYAVDGARLFSSALQGVNQENSKLIAPEFLLKFNEKPSGDESGLFRLVIQTPDASLETEFDYSFAAQ